MHLFASGIDDVLFQKNIDGSIFRDSGSWTLMSFFSYAEEILLRLVLPLVAVGVSIYIAYTLLTAEGDEEKMKKAWKSLSYSAIGFISVMCAYLFVTLISQLSF